MSKFYWETKPLKELCSSIGDGIHATPIYVDKSEYFFINGNNLKDGFITITENTKQVSREEFKKYYVELDESTLLMSINGTLGSLALFRGEQVILGKSAAYINCKSIDRKFCYYYLQLDYVQKKMWNEATGSTIKNLSLDSLKNLPIPIPKLETQQRIAAVLSALDTKIELNNRINAELEAMAKTLYDYWFVQFDFPNEKSKPYKSSGGKMMWDSDLKRVIPEGWKAKPLKKMATIVMGQSPKSESYNQNNHGIPLINGAADYVDGSLLANTFTTSPTRLCKKDDLVFCIRATIGNLTFAEDEFCLGRGVAAVRPNLDIYSELVYYTLLNEIERFKKQASGSIIVGIKKEDLTDSNIVEPSNEIVEKFHSIVSPIFKKQRLNKIENKNLSELRDCLLPMLMNGQVKVK
ncbi:restriction endonuclease subunit S [Methanococcoides sp. LMO-2]|uniref:Restriction endonuclease subunit S n=1 Tax=Methanococcoides cohabitans TaxID=3136559 RepID=A0ABU9KVM2_9EURY